MIKKPIKQIFNNHENVLKKLNLDLTLRPQNLSIDKYFEICKIYEDLLNNFLICLFINFLLKEDI